MMRSILIVPAQRERSKCSSMGFCERHLRKIDLVTDEQWSGSIVRLCLCGGDFEPPCLLLVLIKIGNKITMRAFPTINSRYAVCLFSAYV